MKENFNTCLEAILQYEGGYVNHPRDPGGPTNLGVTLAVAKQLGIDVDGDGDTDIVDIKKLKPKDAGKVFKHEYWDKVKGDDLPSGIDLAVFDFAVNSGVSRAAKYLQAAIGATQDGKIGPKTLKAVNALSARSVISDLCNHRLSFLQNLSTYDTFGRGWKARVDKVRAKASHLAKD